MLSVLLTIQFVRMQYIRNHMELGKEPWKLTSLCGSYVH
jgi:hypothetical protein